MTNLYAWHAFHRAMPAAARSADRRPDFASTARPARKPSAAAIDRLKHDELTEALTSGRGGKGGQGLEPGGRGHRAATGHTGRGARGGAATKKAIKAK